ncbi:hypothetical protein DFH07DRAFT_765728 [Mycena maculata]|uniref:Uncharacterized protein n=1 Tax=Mycena maculata TaxID=230809 RepID=A0AAD7NXP2_9AGAR|nr:hypothetical protein DFH07DRAFT_765728 [Mycena maculata]
MLYSSLNLGHGGLSCQKAHGEPLQKGGKARGDVVGAAFGNWEKELAEECKQCTSATAKQPIDIRLVYNYAELDLTDDGGTITVFEDNVTIHVGEQADAWDPMTLLSSKDPGLESARVAARVCRLLSDAGVKPQFMLDTLEQTGAVMSSSTVGLVVTDLTFMPNDLDVYGTSTQEIVLLTILHDMEFHIDCSQGNSYPSHISMLRVHWLQRKTRRVSLWTKSDINRPNNRDSYHALLTQKGISRVPTAGKNGVSGGGADKTKVQRRQDDCLSEAEGDHL